MAVATQNLIVFRRALPPPIDLPLDRDDVLEILWALANLRADTTAILRILEGEDDEEEADEP
jgi:hypothetical protein